jgi:hypothetical protein
VGGKLEMTGSTKTVTLGGALEVGGIATIGALTTTAQVNITFNGATASIASYAAKADSAADTFAGAATLTIDTLTDAGSASQVTFDGPTTITAPVTTGTGGLTIDGTGAVTLVEKPVVDATKLLTVSNSGGVTLKDGIDVGVAAGLTIATGGKVVLDASKAITITGSGTVAAGSNIVIGGVGELSGNKDITIEENSFTVPADATLTLKGATTVNAGGGKVILALATGSVAADTGTFTTEGTSTLEITATTIELGADVAGALKIGAKGSLTVGAGGIIEVAGVSATTLTSDGTAAKFIITSGAKLSVGGTATGSDATFTPASGKLDNGTGTGGTFASGSEGTYTASSGFWTK